VADTITSTGDVREGYEGTITNETYVTGLIRKAERVLARRLGPLADWATTDERRDAIKDVVGSMVQRVLRNEGSINKSESDGDYSYTRDPLAASANLWVTAAEWDMLLGPSGPGVGTIRVGIPDWSPRRGW
jgi:hypothetical protein